MLPGIKIQELKRNIDERGSFAEIFREDWKDLLGQEKVAQANLSSSFPGIVRAWHRHNRGQIDHFVVLKGALKICAYDDRPDSHTKGELDEIVLSEEKLQVLRVPGFYWHGTKTLGVKPSMTVYYVNQLYDAKNPDEDRRPWNDPVIIDPKTGRSFDWNKPAYK